MNRRGFTLIELVITIMIIGILSAIIIPNFVTFMSKKSQPALGASEYEKYNGSGCFIGVLLAKAPSVSAPRISTPKVSTPAAKMPAPKVTDSPKVASSVTAKPLPKPLVTNLPPAKVQESRSSYYNRYSYTPPMQYDRPSYGFFNSPWLWFFIGTQLGGSTTQAAQVMHHHSDDENMKQFWNDAKKKAETDPELAKRLADIETEKAKLVDQPKNPEYVPEGVPTEVAVTTEDEYKKYNGSSGCFISTLLGD